MKPIILLDIQTESNIWTLVELPDKVRDSISFQAASLGILEYSFDAGVSYMKTVGAGTELRGNFSKQNIWFRTSVNDYVKIMVLDRAF